MLQRIYCRQAGVEFLALQGSISKGAGSHTVT